MTYMFRDDREEYDAADTSFDQILEELKPGDCLVVQQFSGAAKNAKGFLNLLLDLEERDIRLRSIEEDFDTGTAQGRFAAEILKKVAALDEDYRRERQREGINSAKEEGKYKGRKPIEVDEEAFDAIMEKWKNGEITARQAMTELNLKPNTFYRRAKERMSDMKNGEAILNAAKQLGKEIIAGVTAETEGLSQAAEKFAAEHDISSITNSVTETIGKNINAAGSVINQCIDSLSKNFQSAVGQMEKKRADAAETAKDAEEVVADTVEVIKDEIVETVEEIKEAVAETIEDMKDKAAETVEDGVDAAAEVVEEAKDAVAETVEETAEAPAEAEEHQE